jgi:hypothetical protein
MMALYMDKRQQLLCKQLARMESEQAADWLINTYPLESMNCGEALVLLPHRSWRRPEQKKLARYYFKKLPFASSRGYESFASFMSIKAMLECVKEYLPMSGFSLDLLHYYLIPVLNKTAKNNFDRQLIDEFVKEIREKKWTQ